MTNEPLEEQQDQQDPRADDAADAVDVDALKAERDALQDRLLRTVAEFDSEGGRPYRLIAGGHPAPRRTEGES